jgi:hypothetical protein
LRNLLVILLFTIGVCHGQEKKIAVPKTYSWIGMINKKIPVELNFTVSKDIVLGEIRYLNTKAKLPIRIIGYINSGNGYVLSEYGKDGTISGIINAKLDANKFAGAWNPIDARDSYAISLRSKDNRKIKQEIFSATTIAGKYAYQYGERGYQGIIEIKRNSDHTYSYEIGSVTSDPARNQADASDTAVRIKNNQFVIGINKSCKFKVILYNGFLIISANDKTQLNDCEFGANATLEGTYLKIK